jgi:transposase InsO family protein
MIDENIVFLSPSSVYRILKQANLIKNNKKTKKYDWEHKYSNQAYAPDELWQIDITYLKYKNKNVYQLSFIDVYSRFIVLSVTLLNMQADTISSILKKFLEKNIKKLKNKPILQSDNGSSFISSEFRSVIGKYNIIHNTINPGTPTENAIIERWHRTFKENLFEYMPGKDYQDMLDKIEKTCYIYNYKRYHSALGYVTPFEYYRGNPEAIYKKRKEKLILAKQKRIEYNKKLYVQ